MEARCSGQLSYFREACQARSATGRVRTGDLSIFSRALYQLSYSGGVGRAMPGPWRRVRDSNPRPFPVPTFQVGALGR